MSKIYSKPPKCRIFSQDDKGCKSNTIKVLKVKVFHPNSGRHSIQHWPVCKYHYELFLDKDGKGWYTYYIKTKKKAFVVDYEVKELILSISII